MADQERFKARPSPNGARRVEGEGNSNGEFTRQQQRGFHDRATREAIAARLHELEMVNQRLAIEKQRLESQLLHVLGRFAPRCTDECMSKDEAKDFIFKTIEHISPTLSTPSSRTKAPLAIPDYSGLSESLIESVGEQSPFDYSSLSDAYDELCLQKDFVEQLISSESNHLSDKDFSIAAKHEKKSQQDTSVIGYKKSNSELILYFPDFPEADTEYIKPHPSYGDEAESKLAGPSTHKDSSYPRTRQLKTPQVPRDFDSVHSSKDSYSIFYSSSSASSSSLSSPPTISPSQSPLLPVRGKTKVLSLSVPSSPVGPTIERYIDRTRPRLTETTGRQRRKIPVDRSPKEVSKPGTKDHLIMTMRKIYGLPTEGQEYHKKIERSKLKHRRQPEGPPRITISRREFKPPAEVLESSETTSANSIHYVTKERSRTTVEVEPIRFETIHATKANTGQRDVSQQTSNGANVAGYSRSSHEVQTTPMYGALANGFLNSMIRFEQVIPSNSTNLFENQDFAIITKMTKLITGLDNFTCNHIHISLLQIICPPYTSHTPILSPIPQDVSHSRESSGLTSEYSGHVARSTDPSNSTEPEILIPSASHQKSTPEQLTGALSHGYPTSEMTMIESQPMEDPQNSGDVLVFQAPLYRLSSRIKIWRLYNGQLTIKNLLLFGDEMTNIKPPKYCVALNKIHAIRKPHNLSVSITTGLAMSDPLREKSSKFRMGSVPVTRKFPEKSAEQEGHKNYGHFEIIEDSGKTHRFRGTNATGTDKWMTHIKRVLRAVQASEIVQRHQAQLITQGWLQRIKEGDVNWVWCRLMGHYLIFSQRPGDILPSGFKSLEGVQIRTMHTCLPPMHGTDSSMKESEKRSDDPTGSTTTLPIALTSSSDSDVLSTDNTELRNRTIALWTERADPVYIVCPTEKEFRQWRDHLFRACEKIKVPTSICTDLSTFQTKLCEHWRILVYPTHANDPYHTNEFIKTPLSKTSPEHSNTCLTMFACILFLSYPQIEYRHPGRLPVVIPPTTLLGTSHWLCFKLIVIRYLANMCFSHPQLKDELFIQLIKQATLSDTQIKRLEKRGFPQRSKKPVKSRPWFCLKQHNWDSVMTDRDRPTKTGEILNDSPTETGNFEVSKESRTQLGDFAQELEGKYDIQFPASSLVHPTRPEGWWPLFAVWECLSLLLPLFLPSTPVVQYIELVLLFYCELNRNCASGSDSEELYAELAKYATFCKETLSQTLKYGGRKHPPSALEITSISIRNPYTHRYPFSIPIRLPHREDYEVISFNGNSDFQFAIDQIITKRCLPSQDLKGACRYAVYLRLIGKTKPMRYLYMRSNWKICEALSLYEQAVMDIRREENVQVHFEELTPILVFRVQAFSWKKVRKITTGDSNTLTHFLAHQFHEDLLNGIYPINQTVLEITNLIAFLCRADFHDYGEMQRNHTATLSQIVHLYYPKDWIANKCSNGRTIIQLKLLLLDRWTRISKKSSTSTESGRVLDGGDAVPDKSSIDPISKTVHAASISYLRTLRDFLPERFGPSCFPAHISNLPGQPENKLLWLVPQENQLNIFSNFGGASGNRFKCIETINYNMVRSFGGLQCGTFFLVYTDRPVFGHERTRTSSSKMVKSETRSPRKTGRITPNSPTHAYFERKRHGRKRRSETSLRKLRIYLTDLNSVLELSDTLYYFMNLQTAP